VLARAWDGNGTLVLAGEGPLEIPGALRRGKCEATDLRNLYAGSDVVVVPSVPTRDFLEPWGLVVNEAFHQGVPVIATDAVGAAAGGLVRHERTGLVVPANDPDALRAALHRLHDDPALRARLGAAGRAAAAQYTPAAWAEGMSRALTSAEKAC
jgi:glycosyltransferase involved in cell wall biosynthesis